MLLIDQSGSMDACFGNCGDGDSSNDISRWQAVRDALTDPTDGVVTKLQSQVRFAASLYTSNNGGPTCPVITYAADSSDPALNKRDDIDTLLGNSIVDDTPTGDSIDAVRTVMKDWTPDPNLPHGGKVMVVATDGFPDSCEYPDPDNQTETDFFDPGGRGCGGRRTRGWHVPVHPQRRPRCERRSPPADGESRGGQSG